MEQIEAPINEATQSPYLAIYQYPIKGNNLIYNDTHVFWPSRQRLFSKFYMKFTYDNQEFFGVSQQEFAEQRAVTLYPEVKGNFGNNDFMHFVKAKGGWVDKNPALVSMHDFEDDEPAEIPFLEQELSHLKEKAGIIYLNQYKIPFAVTYSQVCSETAWPIMTCDIPADSA